MLAHYFVSAFANFADHLDVCDNSQMTPVANELVAQAANLN